MKAALLQLTSGDDPQANIEMVRNMMRQAAVQGAKFILTPEVTNCVSTSRAHQEAVLMDQDNDPTLIALRGEAAELGVWLLIGSLALKTKDPDGRFANRSFLIGPDGVVRAFYDKIHMFDVQVTETETYRESAGYRPGDRAVLADAGFAKIGMTVCYDIRFPHLHRTLAQAGAQILTVPSAFSPVTGAAHWEPLLRARAIETGCYVLAPAQTGLHPSSTGGMRRTYGHSMVISPWGEVLADAGTDPGVTVVDLAIGDVAQARARVPALTHDRRFVPPDA
ncbi:MAG: carbon-nitrogen hydrolase family protein [Rhodobacterales bacterium]|nr:carbon-nitrogen hydrolase family protein [Rhodobacterales bacterium]MDX5391142.1 carbon-nitrogen hydrolase family protein [Rhodobacterales bacterium]MDX5490835.1 carbon-nitrogen hydrolase family protein [Rhodobacterales bacterium]